MVSKKLNVPLYPATIRILIGSFEELVKMGVPDIPNNILAFCFTFKGEFVVYYGEDLRKKSYLDIVGVIVHECDHLKNDIHHHIGDDPTHESGAYLTQWIFLETYKFLTKKEYLKYGEIKSNNTLPTPEIGFQGGEQDNPEKPNFLINGDWEIEGQ